MIGRISKKIESMPAYLNSKGQAVAAVMFFGKRDEKYRKPLDKGKKEWYNAHIIHKGYDEDEAVKALTESRGRWKPTVADTCLLSLPSRKPQSVCE